MNRSRTSVMALSAALWSIFALTALLGAGQFLFACGFALGPRVWNYCPAPVDRSAMIAQAERGERLQRLIHLAEMRLAAKPPCAPVQADAQEGDPTLRRAYERRAKRGALEVFLAWNGFDDLDLLVFCPGGSIGGRHNVPGSCGDGAIDLDANQNLNTHVTSTPIEHAVWRNSIPDGQYRIGAYLYKPKDASRRQSIPFTLTFKMGDEKRSCAGNVQYFPEADHASTANGQPMIARDYYVDWTAGTDLPQCDLRVHEDAYCQGAGCQTQ